MSTAKITLSLFVNKPIKRRSNMYTQNKIDTHTVGMLSEANSLYPVKRVGIELDLEEMAAVNGGMSREAFMLVGAAMAVAPVVTGVAILAYVLLMS
jgi:hypothetical protein